MTGVNKKKQAVVGVRARMRESAYTFGMRELGGQTQQLLKPQGDEGDGEYK